MLTRKLEDWETAHNDRRATIDWWLTIDYGQLSFSTALGSVRRDTTQDHGELAADEL